MNFIDLAAQQARIRAGLDARIAAVLDHGQYVMGPEITELERRLAEFAGAPHALACSSGTDALLMALMAHGVGPGDAIITTPFTFIATAEVISLLGATPVFVDIDPTTFNLVPDHIDEVLAALKTGDRFRYPIPRIPRQPTPKGIIAVDLFGLPAAYADIHIAAAAHDLFVVEDAAQSFGASAHGKKAGALASIACTSFFPAKPLGAYGDGGAVFTNDGGLAEGMISIRSHGQGRDRYEHRRIGINGRLDTLQAAVLLAKLDIFPDEIERRQAVADRYHNLLSGCPSLRRPAVPDGCVSAWAQYSVVAESESARDRYRNRLQAADIPTAVYYPLPLHLQPAFSELGYSEGDFPVSEDTARRIFSLPMHPYLEKDAQERIAEILSEAV